MAGMTRIGTKVVLNRLLSAATALDNAIDQLLAAWDQMQLEDARLSGMLTLNDLLVSANRLNAEYIQIVMWFDQSNADTGSPQDDTVMLHRENCLNHHKRLYSLLSTE